MRGMKVDVDVDADEDLMEDFIAGQKCHATFSFASTMNHIDIMGEASMETKMGITIGPEYRNIVLPECGSMCELVQSGMSMPVYGVQTLIGGVGCGDEDGDLEISAATDKYSYHGNLGVGPRGVYLRSKQRIYTHGAALCDHPPIGSPLYIANLQLAGNSLRMAWTVAAAGSRAHWNALSAPQKQALQVRFRNFGANNGSGMQQLAKQMNPRLP